MGIEEAVAIAFVLGAMAGGLFTSWIYEKKIIKEKEKIRTDCAQTSSDI